MRLFLVGLAAGLALLAGCDRERVAQLEEGVATEADVRAQFGKPEAIYDDEDGSRTLEYPRQPEGQRNYMITIGPDGRMSALRQVLQPAVFAQVTPGLDKVQVRRLLGRPGKTQVFPLKNEEVWDWRYLDGPENRVFSVSFDPDGKVIDTASSLDPRETQGGG
ncbi:outer membrane protein assembly factor BamE [Aquabacterium sp. A7-Y]|uniref:outer membrane protein assembly factor BamE domain-containing protein n=1 Tax=Aquabacterium sp. A7-Y TaxID=1349605 RepID=UPI00223CEE07|nr:outer membrane protein assembly factor BamE [Aquabacterium sp. A7-Y]MCW7538757.1 outer membrane protein assembly factor BamE [Aquabacterium sp. A7-Y]